MRIIFDIYKILPLCFYVCIVCWHEKYRQNNTQRLLFGMRRTWEGSGAELTSLEATSEYMGAIICLLWAWLLLKGPQCGPWKEAWERNNECFLLLVNAKQLILILLDCVPLLNTRHQNYGPLLCERRYNKQSWIFVKGTLYLTKFFLNIKGVLHFPTLMCWSIIFYYRKQKNYCSIHLYI